MGKLRQPELPPGALAELVQELHALHVRAGRPSTRDLAKGQRFSYTAVHDLFTKTTTESPRLPLLLAVVERLATLAPRSNVEEILDQFDALWRAADAEPFGRLTEDPPAKAATATATVHVPLDDEPAPSAAAARYEPERLTRDDKTVLDQMAIQSALDDTPPQHNSRVEGRLYDKLGGHDRDEGSGLFKPAQEIGPLQPELDVEESVGKPPSRAMTKELFFLANRSAPLHDAAAELRRAGYLVRDQPRDLDGRWSLMAYSAASELTDDDLVVLDGIADRCGVDFDGWGTYLGPPEFDDSPGKPSSRTTLSSKALVGARSIYSAAPIAERQLTGHTEWVKAVAVTELSGRPVVVSGSSDRTMRAWDLATGEPIQSPSWIRRFARGHPDTVEAMAVAQLDGRPVVLRCGFGKMRVWDLATNRLVGSAYDPRPGRVSALAVAQLDGRPVAVVGGSDGAVRLWNLATGELVGSPFALHRGSVQTLAVAQLGGSPVVVSGGTDATIRVFGLEKGSSISSPFIGHTDSILAVAVTQLNGRPVVVSGGRDATVRVWDLATGQPSGPPFLDPVYGVPAVAVAQLNDRPVVVSSGSDGEVQVWDLANRLPVGSPLTGHTGSVSALATAEFNGRPLVVSGSSDHTVRV